VSSKVIAIQAFNSSISLTTISAINTVVFLYLNRREKGASLNLPHPNDELKHAVWSRYILCIHVQQSNRNISSRLA